MAEEDGAIEVLPRGSVGRSQSVRQAGSALEPRAAAQATTDFSGRLLSVFERHSNERASAEAAREEERRILGRIVDTFSSLAGSSGDRMPGHAVVGAGRTFTPAQWDALEEQDQNKLADMQRKDRARSQRRRKRAAEREKQRAARTERAPERSRHRDRGDRSARQDSRADRHHRGGRRREEAGEEGRADHHHREGRRREEEARRREDRADHHDRGDDEEFEDRSSELPKLVPAADVARRQETAHLRRRQARRARQQEQQEGEDQGRDSECEDVSVQDAVDLLTQWEPR